MAMESQETTSRQERSEHADALSEGTNDLIIYLVVRFIAVLLIVMLMESLVVVLESAVLLPVLRVVLMVTEAPQTETVTSIVRLIQYLFALMASVARGNYLQVAGISRGSLAILLLLAMLLLLMLPPAVGGLAYSRLVVRRLRELQEVRERELALIDQQRSLFLTDIAHDLRTPLMAISGMAHAIADGVVRDESQRDEYLRSIGTKADSMSELVSTVFDYAKLGSGSFALDRERIDLPQLLLREAAAAYTDIEDASMTLSVDVDETPCAVNADPTQLARVVANLLSNAIRHNRAGTEIALALVRQVGVAYVVVADSGERIEGDPEELFRPFSRGDAARSESGGSGLGLSICKRIADLHGYELELVQPYGRFTKAFVLRCVVVG